MRQIRESWLLDLEQDESIKDNSYDLYKKKEILGGMIDEG